LLAGIAGELRKSSKTTHRVRLNAHIASVKTEIISPTAVNAPVPPLSNSNSLIAEILKRWNERGKDSNAVKKDP
jgi:hypothetical protein